jgi:hypothetical protein
MTNERTMELKDSEVDLTEKEKKEFWIYPGNTSDPLIGIIKINLLNRIVNN